MLKISTNFSKFPPLLLTMANHFRKMIKAQEKKDLTTNSGDTPNYFRQLISSRNGENIKELLKDNVTATKSKSMLFFNRISPQTLQSSNSGTITLFRKFSNDLKTIYLPEQELTHKEREFDKARRFSHVPVKPQVNTPSLWHDAEVIAKMGSWEYTIGTKDLFCSDNLYNLLRTTKENKLESFESFLPSFVLKSRTTLKDGWGKLLRNELQALDQEVRLANAQECVWLRLKAQAVYQESSLVKIIGTFQDVSEYKEKEAQYAKQKEQAEQEAVQKAEFVALLNHEMRTPLNAIMGLSFLLLQEDTIADCHKESIDSIHFSSQNLLALVNNTLDLSKIEAGKAELEKVNFQLKDLMHNIHRSLRFRAHEKQIDFNLTIDKKTPSEVAGDPAKLTQIINNLVSNAIKFTHKGSVNLAVDVVYQSDLDSVLEFTVSDTGVGIPKEQQEQVFESYVQANSSISRQYGGTGLGLAITKKLVDLHKGSISLRSMPGQGSVFTVRIKYSKAESTLTTLSTSNLMDDRHLKLQDTKILVIDDNSFNRMVARKLLVSWNAEVETAHNGFVALQKIQATSYDVVLMDLHMPVMDGFETIAEIRKYDPALPVIALTGNASEEEKQRILTLGCNDYLTKPFIPQVLYKRIVQQAKLRTPALC